MKKFISIFCYTFVVSIAVAMIFFPDFDARQPVCSFISFLPAVSVITLFRILLGLLLVLFFVFRKTYFPRLAVLLLIPFVLGLVKYWQAIDTSSPFHIKNHLDNAFWFSTGVRGTIVQDPDIRDDKTLVVVKPDLLIKGEKQINLQGNTGLVMVNLYPSIGDYYNLVSYGDYIQVQSAMVAPKELSNPYGFNYAKYLRARNIYAVMYVKDPRQATYLGSSKSSPVVQFSLRLKRRILWTIRQTMMYPQSAFLGGVTLGLRGGVPRRIKEEFQATGVAHVLAVSGLHVGFVALLFMALTGIFHIKGRIRWPLVTAALVVFTIITGARPATMRAALMFSIGLFLYEWAHLGIAGSTRLTIPISSFIILMMDPLMLPDGSFVLSFLAVWSLAYITDPMQKVMERFLVGFSFLAFIIWCMLSIFLLVCAPGLFSDPSFTVLFVLSLPLFMKVGLYMNENFPLQGFEFRNLPDFVVMFTYAQFAIQIGMMIPLSALYFNRFPISGILANFIAIPLIGIIVQLGLIAGLLDVILSGFGLAALGLKVALFINAANYIASEGFLWMSSFFYKYFPYPYTSTPDLPQLGVYYILVCAFIWHEDIIRFVRAAVNRVNEILRYPELSRLKTYAVILAVLFVSGLVIKTVAGRGPSDLKVVFFDVSLGNSVYIRTPSGRNILVDGGARGEWGAGKNVLAPNLSGFDISRIDKMVATSLRPGNIGGLIYLMDHFVVKEAYLPVDTRVLHSGLTYSEFVKGMNDDGLFSEKGKSGTRDMYMDYHDMVKSLERKKIPSFCPDSGTVILEEEGEKPLRVEVIHPPAARLRWTSSDLDSNSLILRITHGKKVILVTSWLTTEGVDYILKNSPQMLQCDVLHVPSHGHPDINTDALISAADPSLAVLQFGYSRASDLTSPMIEGSVNRYINRGIRLLRTDKNGAVMVTSDGEDIEYRMVLEDKGG